MENVDVTKENLCINKIVGQKNESFFVEDDTIIPDIKPDILNAISTNGNVCVYKKEVLDGKIRIDGTVNVYVMYLADSDSDTIRGVNTNIDFTHILDIESCKSDMNLDEKISIKTIECKVLNGRKINVKVGLELETTIYSEDNIEIITGVNNIENIQMLNQQLTINSLLGTGNSKAYAKDTILIDDTDNLAEILKCNLDIVNKDIKISYNKILAKADVNIQMLYLTEENRLKTKDCMIPVMGFIDMPNISEDNVCDIDYSLSNMVIKPNQASEHSIYIEAEVSLSAKVYENRNIDIIQDLYCPTNDLKFKKKEVKTMLDKNNIKETCNIRQKVSVPEIGSHQLYNVDLRTVINNTNIMNNKVMYEGEIELNFVFGSDNISGIDTKMQKIPFDFTVEIDNLKKDNKLSTNIEVTMQDFILIGDGNIDTKIDLLFDIGMYNTANINVIDEITSEDNIKNNPYSMTIYFVKKEDTLWNIAKRFKSTKEDIMRINEIDDESKITRRSTTIYSKVCKHKIWK